MDYDPRNDAYSHSDKDVMNFAKAISSGKGFYDADVAESEQQRELVETDMSENPYFLALDKSEMNVAWKKPKTESYEDVDVSELVQLADSIKNGTVAAPVQPKVEATQKPEPSVK